MRGTITHPSPISSNLPSQSGSDYLPPGSVLLPLRLIVGWTYFSAFWRRMVLENKLDPDAAGYIGEKFNHFLPNALFIKPQIEFFVSNPDLLWWKLLAFTIVEGIVGLCLMLGVMTRIMGIATSLLALGILLGAGWLGTTCLDEWQIGILGIGSGIAFAWAGGGRYSADQKIFDRFLSPSCTAEPAASKWRRFLRWSFDPNPIFQRRMGLQIIAITVISFGLTLYTNQVFHHGVWGKLKNMSVSPKVELSDAKIQSGELSVQLYRTEGADVYGSFAIEIRVVDVDGSLLANWDGETLAKLSPESIENRYVAKIKPGKHSLVLPLGAKGTIKLRDPRLAMASQPSLRVELVDVSGAQWSAPVQVFRN